MSHLITILFDFDGTLADTYAMGLERLNAHAPRFGYRPVEEKDIPEYRRMRVWQVAQRLGIRAWSIPRIARRIRKDLREKMGQVPVFPGVAPMLRDLHHRGFRVGIVSSNNKKNILKFLESHRLDGFFHFIEADRSVFGKWKCLKKEIKAHDIDPSKAVFIGDELRDLEAAWRNGVPFMPVSWGLNDPLTMERECGIPALGDPADLWERLKSFPITPPLALRGN